MSPIWIRTLVLVCVFGAVVLAAETAAASVRQLAIGRQSDQPAPEPDRARPDAPARR